MLVRLLRLMPQSRLNVIDVVQSDQGLCAMLQRGTPNQKKMGLHLVREVLGLAGQFQIDEYVRGAKKTEDHVLKYKRCSLNTLAKAFLHKHRISLQCFGPSTDDESFLDPSLILSAGARTASENKELQAMKKKYLKALPATAPPAVASIAVEETRTTQALAIVPPPSPVVTAPPTPPAAALAHAPPPTDAMPTDASPATAPMPTPPQRARKKAKVAPKPTPKPLPPVPTHELPAADEPMEAVEEDEPMEDIVEAAEEDARAAVRRLLRGG